MIDSAYISVLKDSFLSNFIFTISDDFAFPFLISLGKHDKFLAAGFGFIGSVLGLIATYLVFFALAKLLKKLLESNSGYPAACHYTAKLSPLLGILAAFPKLSIIPSFFFGLTRVNFLKFLIIIVFYRAAYYIYILATVHPVFAN